MSAAADSMAYDVVIVGGGPAGLSAAIRLKQCASSAGREISVCLLEKGSEIGAHILSGAIIDPEPLRTLLPDWPECFSAGGPLETEVAEERLLYLTRNAALALPQMLLPKAMQNHGMRIGSLGRLCRALAEKAEALGVEIYPGFAAVEILYGAAGEVTGVVTGAFGIAKDGHHKPSYTPGLQIEAKYTLLAEGARGFLSEALIERYGLREGPQKYGIGIKELWELPPEKHRKGLALHTLGWPLDNKTSGGMFAYHWGEAYCALGLVVHLDYENPYLSPFSEFQRAKSHPVIRHMLEGGRRVGYGARAIAEGGLQSLPELVFPGGALIGCAAGFLNLPRLKGSHNAIRSGMAAAEAVADALVEGRQGDRLSHYASAVAHGAITADLKPVRNVKPLWSRFGTLFGVALAGFDLWSHQLFGGSLFGTLSHTKADWQSLRDAKDAAPLHYPKPDGVISFDIASSLYCSGTDHEADQPVHLKLADPGVPLGVNLPRYGEPAQRYCPAGVYEIVDIEGAAQFQINAANCLHCKTCEIKDPSQNIRFAPPEGGGGPNYADM
ncbi:electron-transferring-flavoprotein dehydrogenase [Rhizomicrobium palustre]|uniref:Electron transfer flavoprotein-ubiquinone oxidoreductase n=1 Tax=Rhizomicrobium palustre TaxID=189966 RepID=A0A846MZ44_9PROT|nr:electron transfer flavoprotein-ubiquinone oxidoreductase [Rhizomicrobium palustre]NIK88282.1 electron-transferring-flavoprotein dehydrogenase [Rhizomicrobium palustre]